MNAKDIDPNFVVQNFINLYRYYFINIFMDLQVYLNSFSFDSTYSDN